MPETMKNIWSGNCLPPVFFVDGYNIIGHWTKLKKKRDNGNMVGARDTLLEEVAQFAHYRGCQVATISIRPPDNDVETRAWEAEIRNLNPEHVAPRCVPYAALFFFAGKKASLGHSTRVWGQCAIENDSAAPVLLTLTRKCTGFAERARCWDSARSSTMPSETSLGHPSPQPTWKRLVRPLLSLSCCGVLCARDVIGIRLTCDRVGVNWGARYTPNVRWRWSVLR
eukprot:2147308-Rhodomonas_salina.1